MALSDTPPSSWYEPPPERAWCRCDRQALRHRLIGAVDTSCGEADWRRVEAAIEEILDACVWDWCKECASD